MTVSHALFHHSGPSSGSSSAPREAGHPVLQMQGAMQGGGAACAEQAFSHQVLHLQR